MKLLFFKNIRFGTLEICIELNSMGNIELTEIHIDVVVSTNWFLCHFSSKCKT